MRKIALPFIAIVLVGSATWYFYNQQQSESYSGPVETLRFCTAPNEITSALIYIAHSKGYFEENGLDVQFSYHTAGKFCLQDLVNKKADVATFALFPFVTRSFNKADLNILASIASSEKDIQMVTRKKFFSTPKDLHDKTIGVTTGTDAHFFLDSFLIFNGINPSEVTIIDLKPQELPVALADGRVDAIATWQPNISAAQKALGEDAHVLQIQNSQYWEWLLVSRQDVITNKSDAITRLLKALVQAEMYIKSNPVDSKRIVSQQTKIEPFSIDSLWQDHTYSVTLSQDMLLSLENEARWAISKKLTDAEEIPNYLKFIYFDAMEKVKPEAITIVH